MILPNVIPTIGTTLVEQRRIHISNDILLVAELTESLRVLRSRRNALVCISWLPSEIFPIIFTYVEEESYTDTAHHRGSPAGLVVTHVCSHWRQTARDCLTLWASLVGSPSCLRGRRQFLWSSHTIYQLASTML
ncbi:hypothetical protein EDB19DRAFT_1132876 [Suillus lakei]|nr:hypothetical protein EDB19DRAFT_1132876 [Suillus lakei]